jgi:hypothetical protein
MFPLGCPCFKCNAILPPKKRLKGKKIKQRKRKREKKKKKKKGKEMK